MPRLTDEARHHLSAYSIKPKPSRHAAVRLAPASPHSRGGQAVRAGSALVIVVTQVPAANPTGLRNAPIVPKACLVHTCQRADESCVPGRAVADIERCRGWVRGIVGAGDHVEGAGAAGGRCEAVCDLVNTVAVARRAVAHPPGLRERLKVQPLPRQDVCSSRNKQGLCG